MALLLLILALIFSVLTSGMDYDDCMLKPFTTHKRQTAPDTNASPENAGIFLSITDKTSLASLVHSCAIESQHSTEGSS